MVWSREKRAEYSREWAKRNAEKVREHKRRSREKHRQASAARRREYRRLNRERLDAAKRKWERENPERVAAARAIQRIRKAVSRLAKHVGRHYSLTVDGYLALVERQRGRCAICGVVKCASGRSPRLHLDHDHATGAIRGLLCNKCNSAIGYLNDDPARLRRAADYLEGALYGQARLIPDGPGGRSGLDGFLGKVPESRRQEGRSSGVGADEAIQGGGRPDSRISGLADCGVAAEGGLVLTALPGELFARGAMD